MLVVAAATTASAQTTRRLGSRVFIERVWTVDDGLPSNSVPEIIQTPDGFLWLATFGGLARFDGVRFDVFDIKNTPALKSNRIFSVVPDRDSAFWILSEQHDLARYDGKNFRAYDRAHGAPFDKASAIATVPDGSYWVVSDNGLLHVDNGKIVQRYGANEGVLGFDNIARASDGTLLFASTGAGGVYALPNNAPRVLRSAWDNKSQVFQLRAQRDGSVAVASYAGVGIWMSGVGGGSIKTIARAPRDRVRDVFIDRTGDTLVATSGGLYRVADGAAASHEADDLNGHMFEDREGNLWFSPLGQGLVKWTPARVTSITKRDGLSWDDVWSVVEDKSGDVWLATGGVSRLHGGRLHSEPKLQAVTMHADEDGGVWLAGGEVTHVQGTAITRFPWAPSDVDAPRSIYRAKSGRVFIGRNAGVIELRDGKFLPAFDGALRDAHEVALITEGASGAMYFGGTDGLRIARDGRITHMTTADGLPHNHVRAVYEELNGSLWIGTYGGGLSRFKAGRFARLTTDQGLVEDVVSRILEDGTGYLYMSGNRGVSRVSAASLDSVADGTLGRVTPTLFTVADGMPSNETEGWVQWGGWRAHDGKLLFATVKGLAIIDPTIRHTLPPPVAVTDLLLDGNSIPRTNGSRAPPSEGNLEIHYTALSFIAPDKVRFKYRLDGFDDHWVDPGTRRTAYYTKVPPGDYTFRVLAANDDGVWNESGAAVRFTLEPHWYQRRSVWAFALLVLIAGVAVAVRARIRSLQVRIQREQQVAERLREVDKLKDEFLANTSHELRTPLNGIIGLAQSLTAGVAGPLNARASSDLSLIATSGQRLSRLVNDILDLSRLRHGDLALHLATVDVESAVTVALTLSRPLVSAKPVTLERALEPHLPPVLADEDRLQQILLNLIGNAVKFTARGSVTVSAHRAGDDAVEIAVTDTGIGISAEDQVRIFEPFVQADASTTRRFGGTGLGLSVTRQLVELHGGTIRVESSPGAGARFIVRLPIAASAHAANLIVDAPRELARLAPLAAELAPPSIAAASTGTSNGKPAPGKRVLVVDDDAVNTRVISNLLELDGYTVDVAASGQEALEIALGDEHPPDLILLDIMMPVMDGFTVCQRLRERRSIDVLPVIFVTAKSEVQDLVAGLDAGANDFLTKPVSRDELLGRVRTHISLAEAQRNLRAARDTLEDQVRERTQELSVANAHLLVANQRLEELNGQLGNANQRMRSILDELRTGVVTIDPAGLVTFVSRTAEQILERTADELVAVRWDALVVVDDADRAALKALIAAPPEKSETLPTRICVPSGRRYWVEIEAQENPQQRGGRILYLSDISDLFALPSTDDDGTKFHGLIGQSVGMQLVFKEIRDIARSEATVLIEGETGTGKELVARAIHESSPRRNGPFIALNCAGLTESLLSSQLFGHRRGSFTGAVADQVGLIEAAQRGTLFLDEVGDIPMLVQASLLRALQEREIVRVGETKPRKVDVRILAATHRDIAKRVAEGAFREDLLYRIRVARIKLPPLRRRPQDVPLLVALFLGETSRAMSQRLEISNEAMEFLLEHAWPGNVRELRGTLEHAALRCRGGVIRPNDLPPEILEPSPWAAERAVSSPEDARAQVVEALAKTGGNRSAAARLLGISRPTLYARLRTLGLIDS